MPETHSTAELAQSLAQPDPVARVATAAGRTALALVSQTPCPRCTPAGAQQTRRVVRDALERGAFEFRVQRIVPLGAAYGAQHDYELLLRLRERDGSVTAPAGFLPAAEQVGLAPVIDRYVLEVLLAWLDTVTPPQATFGSLAINLSARSVADAAFRRYVLARLEGSEVPPGRLRFEITETAFMANLHEARRFIQAVRDRGVGVSLDDFGAGFTSLAYLKHLPCDQIKVDAEFVRNVHASEFDRAVVRCVSELADITDMAVVAEGVESADALGTLTELGVGYGQGFYFARPAPLATLLQTEQPEDDCVTPAA